MNKIRKIESYKLNARPFLKPITAEVVYLLGFLYADGYIYENTKAKSVTIRLEIKKEDYEDIKDIINKTGYWPAYNRKRKGRKEQTTIATSNRYLYNFLLKYNYKDRKNSKNILKLIPKNLKYLWYRGYLDGDGCIYFNKTNSCSQLVFASNYDQNWDFIKNLMDELKINKYFIQRVIKNNGNRHSIIRSTNRQSILTLLHYIYQDKINIGLKRKYSKYTKIKEYNKLPGTRICK